MPSSSQPAEVSSSGADVIGAANGAEASQVSMAASRRVAQLWGGIQGTRTQLGGPCSVFPSSQPVAHEASFHISRTSSRGRRVRYGSWPRDAEREAMAACEVWSLRVCM